MLTELRELAGLGGPCSKLANELLVVREQYESEELTKEEYQNMVQEIWQVKAVQELSNDRNAFSFIVSVAQAMYMFV
jgi:hypothetical protein